MTRHINLLDPPQKTRSPYTTALQMGVPIALVLLVMGTWSAVVRYQASAAKARLSQIEAQMLPVSEQLAQLQAGMGVEQVNATLRDRLQRAEAQLKARRDIQTALQRGDLGSSQGFSEFMRAFARQTVPGLWLTGLRLENGGKDITLSGRALNAEAVATLVRQLRAEPALAGRSIAMMSVVPLAPPEHKEEVESSASQLSVAVALPRVYQFEISSLPPPSASEAVAEAPKAGSMNAALELMAKLIK
ncbi:MAG: biosis protein MshI [Rhodocyclales bacterium]|nr:biosis protein MshI [Rhodocyclales bacterium]